MCVSGTVNVGAGPSSVSQSAVCACWALADFVSYDGVFLIFVVQKTEVRETRTVEGSPQPV